MVYHFSLFANKRGKNLKIIISLIESPETTPNLGIEKCWFFYWFPISYFQQFSSRGPALKHLTILQGRSATWKSERGQVKFAPRLQYSNNYFWYFIVHSRIFYLLYCSRANLTLTHSVRYLTGTFGNVPSCCLHCHSYSVSYIISFFLSGSRLTCNCQTMK